MTPTEPYMYKYIKYISYLRMYKHTRETERMLFYRFWMLYFKNAIRRRTLFHVIAEILRKTWDLSENSGHWMVD